MVPFIVNLCSWVCLQNTNQLTTRSLAKFVLNFFYHDFWTRTFDSVMGMLSKCLRYLFLCTWLLTRVQQTVNLFISLFIIRYILFILLTTSAVWRVANVPLTFCFSGCSDCTFNLCTPTRPVILPGNEKLVLAPYHTYYPSLEEHLQGPWGIPIEPNLWNDPLVLGKKAFGDQLVQISKESRV